MYLSASSVACKLQSLSGWLAGAPETHSGMDFLMLRVNTASDIWRLMAQTAIQVQQHGELRAACRRR